MFWDIFSRLCKENGITPNGLAKKLSISSGAITAWKQGRVPQYSRLIAIADFFGVTVDYLLGNEQQKTEQSINSQLSLDDQKTIELFLSLDDMDKAGIRGSIEYMLKNDKYKSPETKHA